MAERIKQFLANRRQGAHYTKPAFCRLLTSFLAMLLLPFAVLLVNYLYARDLLRKENLDYQNAVLVQAQKMIDEQLQTLQLLALDVSNDQLIADFLSSADLSDSALQLRIWQISGHLSNYGATYREFCQSYVYSLRYDCLIGSSAADFGVTNKIIRLETEELNRQLQQKLLEPQQFCRYSTLRDGDQTKLVMMHSVPLWSTRAPQNGTICLLVDTNRLLRNVSSVQELQSGLVCLLDENGQLIMGTGDSTLRGSLGQATALKHGFLSIDGAQYTVSTVASDIGGWSYLSIQPQHTLLQRLRLARNLSVLVFLLVVLLGVGAAYLFSRRNYRPIEKLMGGLELRRKADNENEFTLIERSVQDITSSMSTLHAMVRDELPCIQESMLLQLLRNAVTDYDAFTTTLANLGILLPYSQFAVTVIRQTESETRGLEEQALVSVVIKEQLIKIMPHTIAFAAVAVQNDSALLLTGLGEGVWCYTPWGIAARFSESLLLSSLSTTTFLHQAGVPESILFISLFSVLFTAIFVFLFNKWEGRKTDN